MQDTVKTYAARRVVRIGNEDREGPRRTTDPVTVEHLVPEAHLFFRQETLLHTGVIQEVEVPLEWLFQAFELRQISSTDCLGILERLGLRDGTVLRGPHGTPVQANSTRPEPTRAQKELPAQQEGLPGAHRARRRPVKPAAAPPVTKAQPAKGPRKVVAKRSTTASTKGNGTAVIVPLRDESEG